MDNIGHSKEQYDASGRHDFCPDMHIQNINEKEMREYGQKTCHS